MKYRNAGITAVILIRHAQSQWNRENRFTGWADPPLTEQGLQEARRAAAGLHRTGWCFDFAYSSRLQRAQQTLDMLLAGIGQPDLPQARDWRLNERHYGSLQGLNKTEIAARVGEAQVLRWRRGYHDRPEPQARSAAGHPRHDPRYRDVAPELLPDVESLAETRGRVLQFWREQAEPRIRRGERLLISAHGNTLRALIMALSDMTVAQVERFEIPTAMPIVFRFDRQARPLDWCYLDMERAASA